MRYTRDQIEAIAGYILSAALDRVECQLPDCVPLDEYRKAEATITAYASGAVEAAGMALAILWAQSTGDGMGTFDWKGADVFLKLVETFVAERTDPSWPGLKAGDKCHPEPDAIAKAYADDWAQFTAELHADTADPALQLNTPVSLASLLSEAKTLAARNFSTYAGRPVYQEAIVELCTAAAGLPLERKQEIATLLGINLS